MQKFLTKSLICIIIFLILGIISKKSINYKDLIHNKLYEESISFTKFENLYNKYLGGIFPIENINTNPKTEPVFSDQLTYQSISSYQNGAKLIVSQNYLIPSQENGIITYIGEKEHYGNVIILETNNNLNIWYGNVCNSNLKLYDHLTKGDIIGESCTNELYLVYKQDNEVLDYKQYLN